MRKNNTFHLEDKKKKEIILENLSEKVSLSVLLFSFLDVMLNAHLSFGFFFFLSFCLGLAAGNLRLMFGQFTIQVRNYITAPLHPPFLPSGEWEITLSVQFLSVFGAVK